MAGRRVPEKLLNAAREADRDLNESTDSQRQRNLVRRAELAQKAGHILGKSTLVLALPAFYPYTSAAGRDDQIKRFVTEESLRQGEPTGAIVFTRMTTPLELYPDRYIALADLPEENRRREIAIACSRTSDPLSMLHHPTQRTWARFDYDRSGQYEPGTVAVRLSVPGRPSLHELDSVDSLLTAIDKHERPVPEDLQQVLSGFGLPLLVYRPDLPQDMGDQSFDLRQSKQRAGLRALMDSGTPAT
jgi:hypothetical protein